jgi:hypothetical protein
LAVAQALMGVHVVPSPLYPVLQAQDAVPGPVGVQAAVAAQPPLAVAQASTPVQVLPSPLYPVLQAQELVPGPVGVHAAFASQSPWLTPQEPGARAGGSGCAGRARRARAAVSVRNALAPMGGE